MLAIVSVVALILAAVAIKNSRSAAAARNDAIAEKLYGESS